MKKLLYILLFSISTVITAQNHTDWVYRNGSVEIEDFSFDPPTTDNNMTVVFLPGTLNDFIGSPLQAFVNGNPVSEADYPIQVDGSYGVAVIGSEWYYYNIELANAGDEIQFAILVNEETIINVSVAPPITYAANGFVQISDGSSLSFSIGNSPVVFGCTDIAYLEYNSSANIDDESCSTLRVDGCTDSSSCVYNPDANHDDGSCIFESPQSDFNTCCLNNLITSICPSQVDCDAIEIDCVNPGCMSDWADNFDPFATQDDGSCYRYGCTSDWADNYESISTVDDGSCDRLGCTLEWADNFDYLATINDLSCSKLGCVSDWADNFDEHATTDDESCYRDGCTSDIAVNYDEYATIDNDSCDFDIITHLIMSFETWNTAIDLAAGWNMFGYGCPESIDLVQAMSEHTENIIILKDNNGKAYMPEFGFNGIGDFTPGFGYQIKLLEAIEGFSLCDWYVNDIPEDNIVSLQDSIELINSQIGCTDSLACNFNLSYLYNDGSCDYPEQGYNCEGNINIQVGDEAFGGIVFYIDETGQSGLVAAVEDLSEGATNPYGNAFDGYEWGCFGEDITFDMLGTDIGTGYQNTLDIVNQGCTSENGGITAAQASLNAEINGYNDWYLPSKNELLEMYNTIGDGGSDGNIGGFENHWNWPCYWSSSVDTLGPNFAVFGVIFNQGLTTSDWPASTNMVRPIRSF